MSKDLSKVLNNLNREISRIKGRTLGGLIEAARLVREDMERTSPTIPVATGNLRASFFTVTSRGGTPIGRAPSFRGPQAGELSQQHSEVVSEEQAVAKAVGSPTVVLGFSANYALFVHENYGAVFQRPGAGAGFLKAALERNRKLILDAIREAAKKA